MCVTAGVWHGCPTSPVLFLLATAPIIESLEAVVGPGDLLAMFADDLAIVLRHLWRTLPASPLAFGKIRRHTGLGLQINKCTVVPLWPSRREVSFRRLWREAASGWTNFGVGGAYKYLGILLGPDSVGSMWQAVDAKYADRLRAIRALALGLILGALAHRVLALGFGLRHASARDPGLVGGHVGDCEGAHARPNRLALGCLGVPVADRPCHMATLYRTATVKMKPTSPETRTLLGLFSADVEPLLHPWRTGPAWTTSKRTASPTPAPEGHACLARSGAASAFRPVAAASSL